MKLCLASIVSLALASSALAQIVQHPLPTRGIVPSQAMGMIVGSSPARIQKKQRGLPVALATPAPVVNGADYTVGGIMSALGSYPHGTGALAAITIDGMSTGNDDLPIIWDGASSEFWISQAAAQGWAVLAIGVDNVNQGMTDVFGYYFDNPSFPSQLRNGIYTELVTSDFPDASGRVEAMDAAMGLLQDSGGRLYPGDTPVLDRLYFTLTDASAQDVWNYLSAPRLMDMNGGYSLPTAGSTYTGATIFCAIYQGATCIEVRVCEDYSTLGLSVGDEIDALAVGEPQPTLPALLSGQVTLTGPRQYVFSTVAPAGGEQLMATADVSGPSAGRRRAPVRGNNGDRISGTGGSIGGQFRSLCCWDPEGGNRGWTAIGEPEDFFIAPSVNVINCGFAMETTDLTYSVDGFNLTGVLSGWGSGTPQNSLVYLFVQLTNGPLAGLQGYMELPMRRATDGYYSFDVDNIFALAWPGTNPNENCYRFWIYQIGLANSNITESIRSLVLRRQ